MKYKAQNKVNTSLEEIFYFVQVVKYLENVFKKTF